MAETDPEGLGRYGVCVARGTLTRLNLDLAKLRVASRRDLEREAADRGDLTGS